MTTQPQIRIDKQSKSLWTATFDHPPINLIDPDTIRELDALITQLETDPDVTAIVFESADPDYFLAHYDVMQDISLTRDLPDGPTGMHPWIDMLARLARVPVITIAKIAGRARAAGSEFILSCDIRFASREKAVIGQFEVGFGAVPGGNPMTRLTHLVGRGRALEVLVGCDDFSGDLAERYGYVNRALPDAELDAFVANFAQRVAGFDKDVVSETKAFVDKTSLPDDSELPPAMSAFFRTVTRPQTAKRAGALIEKGFQTRGDIELNIGHHVAQFVKE